MIFVWVSALIPWNIQQATLEGVGSIYYIRTILFQIRLQVGFSIPQNWFSTPYQSYKYQGETSVLADAYLLWTVAAGLFTLTLGLTALYVLNDSVLSHRLDLPENTNQLFGVLLGITAIPLISATVSLSLTEIPGLKIPAGVLFISVFALVLLTNNTTPTNARTDD